MPPLYTVLASVLDIRTDSPRATDRLLVDTNVWAWEFYSSSRLTSSGSPVFQASDYSPYLRLARLAGATRFRTALNLAELLHVVEMTELGAYVAGVGPISVKDYRHNRPMERARVIGEAQRAWQQIKIDSQPLAIPLDDLLADASLARFATEPVDSYDLFLLETMKANGVTQVLTDDGDFSCVPGIEVFTANSRVIAAAKTKGRLVVR